MNFDIYAFAAKHNVKVECQDYWANQIDLYNWHYRTTDSMQITSAAIRQIIEKIGIDAQELYNYDMPNNPMKLNPNSSTFEDDKTKSFSCVVLRVMVRDEMLDVFIELNTLIDVSYNVNDACSVKLKFERKLVRVKVALMEFGLMEKFGADCISLMKNELTFRNDVVGTEAEVKDFRKMLIDKLQS